MNTYATSTPVTDGRTVFAVFSGGSFVALDFDGNVKWTNTDLDSRVSDLFFTKFD